MPSYTKESPGAKRVLAHKTKMESPKVATAVQPAEVSKPKLIAATPTKSKSQER